MFNRASRSFIIDLGLFSHRGGTGAYLMRDSGTPEIIDSQSIMNWREQNTILEEDENG